jgi:hypothetical protein
LGSSLGKRELEQGLVRLQASRLYGHVLYTDLGNSPELETSPHEEQAFQALCTSTGPKLDREQFRKYLLARLPQDGRVQRALASEFQLRMDAKLTAEEVAAYVKRVVVAPFVHPATQNEARSLLEKPAVLNDLQGVLTILLHRQEDWQWPATGVPLFSRQESKRWRSYAKTDVLQTLILEIVGNRLGAVLKRSLVNDYVHSHQLRTVFTSNTFRRVRNDAMTLSTVAMDVQHISAMTTGYQEKSTSNLEDETRHRWLNLLFADVQFYRATNPQKSVYTIQTDIKDYFPSIRYEALEVLLEVFGIPETWRTFFLRLCRMPTRSQNGNGVDPQRGLPAGPLLYKVLAEWLLLPLQWEIRQEHLSELIRYVDDMVWVTSSHPTSISIWSKTQAYLHMLCLETNPGKTSGFVIGSPYNLPVPEQQPTWGMLIMNPDGSWSPHEQAVAEKSRQLAEQIQKTPGIRAKIRCYNQGLADMVGSLVPQNAIHPNHLDNVNSCLMKVHEHLFGEGKGIVDCLRIQLEQSFPEHKASLESVPDAWFYWPITAGGLGVHHPCCLLAPLVDSCRKYVAPEVPPLLDGQDALAEEERLAVDFRPTRWYTFYSQLGARLEESVPVETAAMSGFLQDFMRRGGEVQSKKQEKLRPYWQWVVSTFGPQLLESFGTFRFVLTELVPMQLISGQEQSLSDGIGSVLGTASGTTTEVELDDIPF